MVDSEMSDEWAENRTIMHFFRNVLSPALAELFVRELKNSKYIEESLKNDKDGTSNKDLFTLLKNVDSKGRRNEAKRAKCEREETAGASDTSNTQHLNNIKDKINKDILSKVKVNMLLQESETNKAIGDLWKLDSALLLCILTNDVLQFKFSFEFNVKQSLDTLKKIRNSFMHRDDRSSSSSSSRQAQMMDDLLQNLHRATTTLCTYLGKDITSVPKEYSVSQPQMTSQCPVLKEVQQEIYKHYYDHVLKKHHNHTIQLNIKHLRGHCQPDDFVENLEEFLLKNQVSEGQEPRPILLSGVPGAGKSFILHSLAFNIICEQQYSGDYFLVLLLDEAAVSTKTREIFWEQLLCHLTDLSPQAVQKHGREEITRVLSSYTSSFLFLMDQNLHNTSYLNNLMPCMDRGTWVLSYQGEPETSTFFHVLKVTSLSEEQVHQVLRGILTAEQYNQMSEFYKRCDYKGLISTPDMVHFFAEVCLERYVPFYKLIELYIYKKIHKTEGNEKELIKLGKKAFDTIKHNRKYYREMTDIKSSVFHSFLDQDQSKGYYFKYRVVEDYLAAIYVVEDTVVACESWLKQATLFKRVFEIVCALWSEHQEGISTNMHFITSYLETLFDIANPMKSKTKKKKKQQKAAMETDKAKGHVTSNFARWIFVSKMAKKNQNHHILLLLANLLARKHTWHFKCKLLTENAIDNLSLVLGPIKLNDKLIIKVESGPNVTILTKLWSMLSSHKEICSKASVQLVIHYTERNWVMHENLIAKLLAKIAETRVPLFITKYAGPLLCSRTPQFLKCLCMKELDVLDVYVSDQNSLCQVLAHQQELGSAIVKLNLKVREQMVPSISRINLSSSLPLTLTVFYFEGLQKLLDRFEPPDVLYSLRIYRLYIHENFTLDLTRFSKLKFLSIRFLYLGKLPLKYLKLAQSEDSMEVDDQESDSDTHRLPLQQWTLHLALYLRLPAHLERLLMRNLLFCDDSNILILNRYWNKLPFQRLVLLNTLISISKFGEILQSLGFDPHVEDMRMAVEKKCRLEELPASLSKSAIKRERLRKEEREKRRQNKPDGKELIITSEAELCKKCYLSCTCIQHSINHCKVTYTDFATLVNVVYFSDFLSINYSGEGIMVRKDMCGDLYVQCPLPFLNDEMARKLEGHPELGQVMEALALAQAIYLNHTCLSHEGAMYLLNHLKAKKRNFGKIEPFRLTIFSCFNHICSKSTEEVQHSHFMKDIKEDNSLQQFNFRCECMERCHNFKKSIEGKIYFNNKVLDNR